MTVKDKGEGKGELKQNEVKRWDERAGKAKEGNEETG